MPIIVSEYFFLFTACVLNRLAAKRTDLAISQLWLVADD